MEKYSVLMSCYKRETPGLLDEAIQSIINQTAPPNEIVIVKDGDLTPELHGVLDKYIETYPDLFKIVGYEENRGLGHALNFGLEYTNNELVARMDTDDLSVSDRFETQLKYFAEHPETDILGGDIAEFSTDPSRTVGKRKVPTENDEIYEYAKKRCPFNHMTVMYKKSAVINAGGYIDWFWNEDYYLWLRMLKNGCRFANTGTVLVHARVGEEMYRRRGGIKYFRSEAKLQKYMLKNGIIGFSTYFSNVMKRLIVQVLLPNRLRGWVFKKFARN